jgi:multidrug efflux pump subunit AcrA (membrane-fusion protein)
MADFARKALIACISVAVLSFGPPASAQAPEDQGAQAKPKKPVDVFNRIEGESTVLKFKRAGTVVKKGEWVIEFDSSDLKDALAVQKIGVEAAEAAYRSARMSREVAEIGVKEFVDGISKEDIEQADAAIARAAAERTVAEAKVKASQSPDDRQVLAAARLAEQKALAKKAILVKYSEVKEVKELESEVFKAKEEELMKELAWRREKSKADKLQKDIDACKVIAPIDGTVGYLRPVDEEDTFQERELLLRIFPDTKPKVNPAAK